MRVKSKNAYDKWKPGHYVKLSEDQLQSSTERNEVYAELDATPALRGIKIVLLWGNYEGATEGSYDFDSLDPIIEALRSRGRYLHISIAWKEFEAVNGVTRILPSYMHDTDGAWVDGTHATLNHTTYKYAWALKGSAGASTISGYNLKLWPQAADPNGSTYLQTRINAFFQALAARYDSDDVLVHMTTNEGSVATAVATLGGGSTPANGSGYNTNVEGSDALQSAGQHTWVYNLRDAFTLTPVSFSLNFPREFVTDEVPLLEAGNIGINTPNCNWKTGLNTTSGDVGILTYFPGKKNILHLAAEIQGDDYDSWNGNTADIADFDFPSMKTLYWRTTKDLGSNYCIWQRRDAAAYPQWQGGVATGIAYPNGWNGTTMESALTFLQTDKEVNLGLTGGCNPRLPSAF